MTKLIYDNMVGSQTLQNRFAPVIERLIAEGFFKEDADVIMNHAPEGAAGFEFDFYGVLKGGKPVDIECDNTAQHSFDRDCWRDKILNDKGIKTVRVNELDLKGDSAYRILSRDLKRVMNGKDPKSWKLDMPRPKYGSDSADVVFVAIEWDLDVMRACCLAEVWHCSTNAKGRYEEWLYPYHKTPVAYACLADLDELFIDRYDDPSRDDIPNCDFRTACIAKCLSELAGSLREDVDVLVRIAYCNKLMEKSVRILNATVRCAHHTDYNARITVDSLTREQPSLYHVLASINPLRVACRPCQVRPCDKPKTVEQVLSNVRFEACAMLYSDKDTFERKRIDGIYYQDSRQLFYDSLDNLAWGYREEKETSPFLLDGWPDDAMMSVDQLRAELDASLDYASEHIVYDNMLSFVKYWLEKEGFAHTERVVRKRPGTKKRLVFEKLVLDASPKDVKFALATGQNRTARKKWDFDQLWLSLRLVRRMWPEAYKWATYEHVYKMCYWDFLEDEEDCEEA